MKITQLKEYKLIELEQGTIIEKPAKQQIENYLSKYGSIRGVEAFGTNFISDANSFTHHDIADYLGLKHSEVDGYMLSVSNGNIKVELTNGFESETDLPEQIKKVIEKYRSVMETATAGATSAGAVATVNQDFGAVVSRNMGDTYMNQTVVGPDGKPIIDLGNKKKKKKKNKKSD